MMSVNRYFYHFGLVAVSVLKIYNFTFPSESFTQEELFDDHASTNTDPASKGNENISKDNDVTFCEVESSNRVSENEGRNISSSSSQKDTESKDQNVCEINTAELIALNEAAIEGRPLPDPKARASHMIRARDIELESVESTQTPRTQTEAVSDVIVKKPGNNEGKSRLLEEKEMTPPSKDEVNEKVDHVKIPEKENTATVIRKDKEMTENKENCLPLPNIVQLQSHSANSCYVPSSQVMLH